jgi:hypothetical protein
MSGWEAAFGGCLPNPWLVAEVVVVHGATATLSIVSRTGKPVDFGLYTITFRTVGLLQAPRLIGLGVTLPHILPVTGDEQERSQIITAAVTIVAAIRLTLATFSLLISGPLACVIFGSPIRTSEFWALTLLLTGSLIHGLAYASSKGRLNFRTANVVLAVNLGLIPPVLGDGDPRCRFTGHMHCSGLGPLLTWFIEASVGASAGSPASHRRAHLTRLRRIPGEFALFRLTAAPLLLVLHRVGLVETGQVSLA